MDRKLTIGIPRAFLYYKYKHLWQTFFESLDCQIILSPPTNKQILKDGINYSIDESCLSSKIYMGHVYSLIDKVDYILIPRICSFGKKEMVCTKFNAMYDIIRNTFDKVKILDYDVDILKHQYSITGFIKMGLRLNKKPLEIIKAYHKALQEQAYQEQIDIKKQNSNIDNSKKIKILLVAHPYNTYDKLIGYPIIYYLEQLDVLPIFADLTPKKEALKQASKLSKKLYWTYSKEIIGAISYYKEKLDGIIYLSTFPCGPDSLVNELCLRKIKDLPCCNIVVDELQAEAGLQTRIESFIDIIRERKKVEVSNYE